MASIDEKVKQIVVEQLGVDEGEVTPQVRRLWMIWARTRSTRSSW